MRVDADTMAKKGPTFLWKHGELPGKGDKLPTSPEPRDYSYG